MRTLLAILMLFALTGCLKRKEVIDVEADGAVSHEVILEGSPRDFATTDALPSAENGWKIDTTERGSGDDVRRTTHAVQRFPTGEALPGSFGASAGALAFPTTLRQERRPDGLVFHFERTYPARPFARTEYWSGRFLDEKKLEKAGEDGWTREEKLTLIADFARATGYAQAELAEAASAAAGSFPPERALAARSALLAVYTGVDADAFLRASEALPEAERDAWTDAETARLHDEALSAYVETLGLDRDRAAFDAAYAQEQATLQVTKQTGAHSFEVRLRLPGRLLASNADRVEEDGTLVWEFKGDAFRDRDLRLAASSLLGAE